MKTLIILFLSLIYLTDCNAQSIITEPFDREKWLNSAEYRYDLILRSGEIIDKVIENKSENEIIEILGEPIDKSIRENSGVHIVGKGWITVDEVIDLTYCLDNVETTYNNNDTIIKCLGSYIIYHFYRDKIVDATIVRVEPSYNPKKE